MVEDFDDYAATWSLLIIRAWRASTQPYLRLSVVAKADVRADGGEARHSFGSVDEALAFARHWLETSASQLPGPPAGDPPDGPPPR